MLPRLNEWFLEISKVASSRDWWRYRMDKSKMSYESFVLFVTEC